MVPYPPEERLFELFQAVAERYEGAHVRREDRRDSGPRLYLSCDVPGTILIRAIALDDREVDLWVGETHTPLEFVRRRKQSTEDFLEHIHSTIEALVEGGFGETVWEKGGRVLRRNSVLEVPGARHKVRYLYGLAPHLFTHGRKRQISYRPYPGR
jgi:hypothetical protein